MKYTQVHPLSFTITYNKIVNALVSEITISPPIEDPDYINKNPNEIITKSIDTQAIWDTGATNTVITPKIVEALDLKPTGITRIFTPNGTLETSTYLVTLKLPNGIVFPNLDVIMSADIMSDLDALIGMDVITKGDFCLTNKLHTIFTFRIPSMAKIDFVNEDNSLIHSSVKNIGRNDPCPCGSGKKYKQCHGRNQ
ncbi:MAG: hypothetical protein A2X61_07480 [Ignavibacteria bacterium GWB2_35_12]|nr:MAG: hypothetical protein A2X63_12780 [Ignavibacteria bacterium GWA2_35_8]OGU39169.1 MAG: hypothetical protein A2X61_07480 [Ignavibacteria bacterium GWB2_35_12]OGU89197.1 MAG: hypothetical protein A2220_00870 [Ignavibacteria bacterium RIFOXYA2_FULL_35_10]OGV21035.1 MAG: hypothetical protein A2475_00770 [Ignavibacteria bacterium RIFOXYC2_FULL_35_21]